VAGRESLAEAGPDAVMDTADHDPGEEVTAAGEGRADTLASRIKPRRKYVKRSTLSVRKGREAKSRN
jgi:hypothetical protein